MDALNRLKTTRDKMNYENLLYGRIAEDIVLTMFEEAGIRIFRNGYEYTHPLLAEMIRNKTKIKNINEIRYQSDFIFIDSGNRLHYLEVKYNSSESEYNDQKLNKYTEMIIRVSNKGMLARRNYDKNPEWRLLTEYYAFRDLNVELIQKYNSLIEEIFGIIIID